VYIREAHPADSNWADPQAALDDPRDLDERRKAARRCGSALKMSMPSVVDGVDDAVNMRYGGWPERIYVIDRAGRIAYKGGIGPMGFKPREAEGALKKLLE
jgi:type I thyroxine 5'-deiodinase